MKFTCTQENLREALGLVSHTAAKNTTLPILNNVLISAQNGVISFSTTNLELGISCVTRGRVEQEGSFTVQAKLLTDFINLVSAETINLELEGDVMHVHGQRSQTAIKGSPSEEFPMIPEIKKENAFTCEPKELLNALSQVLFSTSHSETRPEISGVYFKFENGSLIMAATDSYRLAEKSIKCSGVESKEVIIPSRTLGEVCRVLQELGDEVAEQEMVEIYFQDNQVQIHFKNTEIISRLIEGTYPAYKQIIPQTSRTNAVVEVSSFLKATKTASLFSKLGVFDVRIQIDNGLLTVASDNAQLGQSKVDIEATTTGEINTIVLNHRYLVDGLQNISSTYVQFSMTDEASPCVMKPLEQLESGEAVVRNDYLYIIMPIKQ